MSGLFVLGVVVLWLWLIKKLKLGFGLAFIGSLVLLVIIGRIGLR